MKVQINNEHNNLEEIVGNSGEENEATDFDVSDPVTWPHPLPSLRKSELMTNLPVQCRLTSYPKRGEFAFNDQNYAKSNNLEESGIREWLMYSKTGNSLFCFPCILFSNAKTNFTNYWIQDAGFKDFHHQTRALSNHEESQQHFESVINWKMNVKNAENGKSLKILANANFRQEVNFWKEDLKSIIDAILFLARNNLAFRGTTEIIGDRSAGNFLSLIELLAKYHVPLNTHLQRLSKGSVSYLSHRIQDEFISLAAGSVRKSLLENIRDRKYFSILFDATPDSSHKEQISQIIRSVDVSQQGCSIQETFIGFSHCDENKGEDIANHILEILKKENLDIKNCRGQGYDNGSNMAGIYKGVQARLREINPLAIFIPCADHSLNRVGHHSTESVPGAKLILGKIQSLYNFFSGSPSRWNLLSSKIKKTLKSQSSTRWSCKAEAVVVLADEFTTIQETLLEISSSSHFNAQTVADAEAQFNQINNFKFLLGTIIWRKILCRIDITNVTLQNDEMTVDQAEKHLNGLQLWFEKFNVGGFEDCLNAAKISAEICEIDINSGFEARQTRKRLNRQNEDSFQKNVENFKSDFFLPVMKKLFSQFQSRFKEIRSIFEQYSFLWGTKLKSNSPDESKSCAANLADKLKNDLDKHTFVLEAEYLKRAVEPFLEKSSFKKTTAINILDILTNSGLQQQFINCHTALRMFLTLPVTVASNERSFSKLKLIKNYLRSTMGQERLNDLAILSIEHEECQKLSFEGIIEDFSNSKCRKITL